MPRALGAKAITGIHTYGRQIIDADDRKAVLDVLDGDYLTQGPWVPKFEEALCTVTGARFAVAVSSGTAALHLACLAGNIGAGKRVATSAITFVASANAALYCGGETALTDVDPETTCMSASTLAACAEGGAFDAVIPVHFAGLSVGIAEIRRAAGQAVVIEDAAHSLGGMDEDGNPVGSCRFSDMATLSFHPVKTVTTGEGGAITTNSADLAHRLRILRSHGIERDAETLHNSGLAFDGGQKNPWYYEQQHLGYNYRMTDLQAALGLSQLHKLGGFIHRRREITRVYDSLLADVPHVQPIQSPGLRDRSANHLYPVCIDFGAIGLSRGEIMRRLSNAGVGSQVHYIPVYRQPFHAQRGKPLDFPHSEAFYAQCLSLPLHPALEDEDIQRVVGTLKASCLP